MNVHVYVINLKLVTLVFHPSQKPTFDLISSMFSVSIPSCKQEGGLGEFETVTQVTRDADNVTN